MKTPTEPARLFLFPIMTQKPAQSTLHIAIGEIECRRGGLRFPSRLILGEYNRVELDEAYDFVTTTPIGAFSPAFVRKVATLTKQAAAQRRGRAIIRK